MRSDVVCSLDIGSAFIRALVIQPLESDAREKKDLCYPLKENVLGFSKCATKGFSKGVVSNLNLLSEAIEEALVKAEDSARCNVRKIITNISGVHIKTFKSRGSVYISDRPSEITEQDISRCIESARLIAMSLDREVIHLIPEKFYIDDKMEIDDPLSLFGSKLDVDLNIITAFSSILQNLTKAINLAGYEAEEVVISGAGTALGVFDRRELQEGSVVIDVGKDLTEAVLFLDGRLRDGFYFPFGSDDLTQVLQDNLRIMFDEAEDLRVKYGVVSNDASAIYDDIKIPIPCFKNRYGALRVDTQASREEKTLSQMDRETKSAADGNKKIDSPSITSRREISNMLFPKLESIMQDVYKKIEPFLKQKKSVPHISVVGGISKMDGFIEAVEDIFCVPVSMGRIRGASEFNDIDFACALGLARYQAIRNANSRKKRPVIGNLMGPIISKIQALLSEYF